MKKSETQIKNFSLLLKAAQNQEQAARDKLGEIYFPLIQKLVHRKLYFQYLGEDAIGEGCLAFVIAMDSFEGSEQDAFENYLCRAVYNQLGKAMQRNFQKAQSEKSHEFESNSLSNSYDLDVDMEFYLKELQQILTKRQFRIVLMRLDRVSEEKIAKVLKVSPKTVFRELQSIKEKVKGTLYS